MDFQELLSLGLGGAAIAILYVFGVSFILLLICCLFLISFISKLWIKNLSTEQTIEENVNLNTHTVAKVIKKPSFLSHQSTNDTVDSEFEGYANDCPSGLNEKILKSHSEIPDETTIEQTDRGDNRAVAENATNNEAFKKPAVLRHQSINDTVDSDFEECANDYPSRLHGQRFKVYYKFPHGMPIEINDSAEFQGVADNTNHNEVMEEMVGLVDVTNQQFSRPTNIKDAITVFDNSDGKINKEERGKKLEDFEKPETSRSKSIPNNSCNNMLNFLKRIGLERFYPNKLMLMDAMSIRKAATCFELKDVALKFVENIVMMNCTCRDQMLLEFLNNIKDQNRKEGGNFPMTKRFSFASILDDTENEDETKINPLDLQLALFRCSSPMLKQILANKLFMCKLAIPFILPNFGREPLEMCVWPLRSIILESRRQKSTCQDMSVECPCQIVSFVRVGCPSVSKSKLLNEILTDQYHNTFLNKDCPLGTAKRIVSDGMVEAAWYIPSTKSTILRNMVMFLNLRGNAMSHTLQLCGVSQLTDIIVVIVLFNDLEHKTLRDVLKKMQTTNKGVVIAIDAFQNGKRDVKQKLLNFTKTIENYERMVHVCILSVAGQIRSISTIKTEIREAIARMMKENIGESLYDRLPRCEIMTDEEAVLYKTSKQKALKVFNQIPNSYLNVKETAVPLQGAIWASWSRKQKNVNKSSQYKSLPEQGTIKKEMNEDRQKQLQKCKNLGIFMKTFLDILSVSKHSNEDCTVFILWLKHFLDQRSRSVLPGYLSQYQTDWQALKTNRDNKTEGGAINKCREALEKTEYKLAEASFGFEHLCREMGQIYESIDQCKPDAINLKTLADFLPYITAKLLIMGEPFEIMDGDVANVPLVWVKAVLGQLREILGEKKLLALSVLGIQSSGKSTLLNTMFGLQFPVSAGRCTRGVFIQLVPIETNNSKFEYVLVIDTEGLRAPELASQKYSHDNELATFVIGLGDITIINIKGENTAEMKDVLQIAVHAFLRLKLTNEKLNLKQTCVFVHQNVPASDANDKMMQGRQKFVEVLDEMTREAAEQEKIADIQSFNQVIDFDSDKNVWYFSDLWHGDPPMAPANPGYSESVFKVKESIMFGLTKGRDTFLTITDTISRIEDLWNGILKDDFVFSFRNSLELKAYNNMDQQCQTITWKLEKYVLEFIKSEAKSKLVNCVNEEDLEKAVPVIMMKLKQNVDQQVEDLNHEMNAFVEDSTLKDIMIQWTQAKRNRLYIIAESLIMKAKTAVNNNKEELRIQKLRVRDKTKHEMEINNMAKELALQMKGEVPSESVLKEKFNCLWNSWINRFDTKDIIDNVSIKDQIESLIVDQFPSGATFKDGFIDEGRRLPNAKAYQNMECLEGTLTTDYISTKKHLSNHKWLVGLIWREASSETCKMHAIDFANTIFRKIDLKLEELSTEGIRFHPSYVSEILHIVSQEYNDFNQHTKNDYKFNLLTPFRVMILYHVVRYATVIFTRLDDVYHNKNSPKAQMEQYKGTAWELFKNTVENNTEDVIAFGFFRDAIVHVVVDQVFECLPIDARESIRILYPSGKYSLIKDILVHLATVDDFDKYKIFLLDPHTFATKWIRKILIKELFEKKVGMRNECLYSRLAHSRVSKIFLHISKCISDATQDCQDGTSSCMSKWIDAFIKHNCKSSDLPLSCDTLVHVRDRKISNLDTFVVILTEQLPFMEDKVRDIFSRVKSDTVYWKTNPVPEIMDSLWGCNEICMFCHEPCMNTNKDHLEDKFPHKCLQHRPEGISGCRWKSNNKMVVDFCNYSITTYDSYTRGRKKGYFRSYKENYPDWDIPPNSDVSKYWMWVMCKYKEQLKEMYDIEDPDIPENWWLIQKEEALKSL